MEYFNKLKEYILKRGMKKNIQDLTVFFLIGLILIFAANILVSNNKSVNDKKAEAALAVQNKSPSYKDELEEELTGILNNIQGAGNVKVMIYLETGTESVPAYNSNNTKKVTEETDGNGGKRITNEDDSQTTIVTTNDNGVNKPYIIKEVNPKISGVIVTAEGANDPNVKYRLYEAVKTVFNIEEYKINIYPMKKK
ncbi:MAG: stage III sporulation protein AG [Clostridiales bacterium]|nr:stage III sporulation protein AG [Clostridiales bacterium]